MQNKALIFDADRHVAEPISMWREYLDPSFRQYAPCYEPYTEVSESIAARYARLGAKARVPVGPRLMLAGEPVLRPVSERAWVQLSEEAQRPNRQEALRAASTGPGHLAAMDQAGISVAALFPTDASFVTSIDGLDPLVACALARAYNRWLRDLCSADPLRLKGAGLIPRQSPESMLPLLEEVLSHGFKTVVLRPNPVEGRTLSHPDYEPFWEACSANGISVALHEGTHTRLSTVGSDRFHTRFAQHAASHPMEQMLAFLALLEGGVLERHPGLRVAFLEAGCGWLPYWLWRLDELEYKNLSYEVEGVLRQKPSEYFQRQCFLSFEPGEPLLRECVATIGEGRFLFGSDFPHLDHNIEITEQVFSLGLEAPALKKVLYRNACDFFGVKEGCVD